MAEGLNEQIDKGFEGIRAVLAAQKAAQEADIKALKDAAATQGQKLESTTEWITRVEAQVNTARSHGPGDTLKNAIPDRFRKHIDIAERMGFKDPADRVAKGLWWHLQYMAVKAQTGMTPKPASEYRKESDAIEKGWGFDPVLKDAIGEVAGGGANVIATPVEADLNRLIRDNTVVRPLATHIVMTSLTHQLPLENANVTAYIVAEGVTITDSIASTAFSQIALTAKQFAGLATLENALLEDNIIGIYDYLFTSIAEHIGILEDQGALDGTNFTGIRTAASVNSLVTAGVTSGGNLAYPDLVGVVYKALQRTTRKGGYFFMHPTALKNVVGLVDTNGLPIFQYGNVPNAVPPRILGYPVEDTSAISLAQTTKTTSTNIYFGPPSKIVFGDRVGMDFMIDPYSLMNAIRTRIRVTKRTAITVPVGTYFTILKGVTNA